MSVPDRCLIRSRVPCGELVVRLGMPLVDDYLEFLDGRCRPNTVLAAAYDLRVFFTSVGKPAEEIRSADVLGFITAQRTGRSGGAILQPVDAVEENRGVATSTVARRLSIMSGFFGYLQARGEVAANPVPRWSAHSSRPFPSRPGGAADAPDPAAAADPHIRAGRCAHRRVAHPPGPRDGRRDIARRPATVRGSWPADGDLRVAERRVFIADGKGGLQRLVPVSARLFTAVAAYLETERPADTDTDRVFVVLKEPRCYEASTGVHAIHPSGLPLTCDPRM